MKLAYCFFLGHLFLKKKMEKIRSIEQKDIADINEKAKQKFSGQKTFNLKTF